MNVERVNDEVLTGVEDGGEIDQEILGCVNRTLFGFDARSIFPSRVQLCAHSWSRYSETSRTWYVSHAMTG